MKCSHGCHYCCGCCPHPTVIVAMPGVVACINPSGNAAVEGVMSGCGGVDTGELVIEMVAEVWHLTELLYKVAPTQLEGQEHVHTNRPHTHFDFMKHGSKFLMSISKSAYLLRLSFVVRLCEL